jgi:hypothetical protein
MGPAEVPARGLVEYFGDGDKTVGLRVRLYRQDAFDPSPCARVAERERNPEQARSRTETCVDERTTPLAETVTVECGVPNPQSGCWSLPAVPTGTPLVARITDDAGRFVPTYQYGLQINPCVAPPRFDSGTCPESVPSAEPSTDWQCDLSETASPHHGEGLVAPYWYRDLSVISQQTWNTFPQTAGEVRINLGRGAVAGRLYDCDGRSVVNATFGLVEPGTRNTYFNGNPQDTLPSPGRTATNLLGTYANLNTPPGPNGLSAIALQDGVLRLVALERFFQLPETVTIVNPTGRRPVLAETPY